MARIVDSFFGMDVCKALRLDGKKVRDLEIKIPLNDVVTIEATMLMDNEQGKELIEILKKYKLEKIVEDNAKDEKE